MKKTIISIIGLITLSTASLLAQNAAQSFSGTVSDSMCGARDGGQCSGWSTYRAWID